MKRITRVFFISVCFAVLQLSVSSPRLFAEDKIVAIVNSDVITQKDFNDFINFMRIRALDKNSRSNFNDKIESMKAGLLDRLIEDRLILQEAKKNKIIVDESRLKAKINEIKQNYLTDAAFQDELKSQGLVQADVESKIRDQMLMYSIIEQKIKRKIVVGPDEVTSFYEMNKKEFLSLEERDLEVIILENADLTHSLIEDFKIGVKLEDLALKFPIRTDKIKVTQAEGLKKEIGDVVFKLKPKEISDPVNIDGKLYIFKLDEIIAPRYLSLSEVQDKIHNYIFERKMQEELTKWLDELKSKSYIKIMQS